MPWAERAIAAVSSLESDCLSYMKNWKSWDWKRTGHLHTLQVTYTLKDQIRKAQKKCPEIKMIKASMKTGHHQDYRVDEQGTLWLKQRICVPQDQQIRDAILSEAHNSKYSIHPGCTKMYCDLRSRFRWKSMKADIASYVAHCDICQRVKAEHQRPAGLLQPLDIPVWTS